MKKKNIVKNSRKAQVTRKLKMLRKAAACVTLFAGLLTGLAQGQTTITGNPGTDAVNQIGALGVAIEETLSAGTLNVATNTESGGFSTIGYQLTQGLDITNGDTTSNNVVTGIRVVSAASTQTGNKTYGWNGNYNITKSDPGSGDNNVTGFEFIHSSTAGEAAIFAGTISGESMTIVNMQTGAARGLSFHQNSSGGFDIRGGFNGIIDIEALEVSGKGNDQWGHSTGLFAGNLGTLTGDGSAVNINIDTLNVSSDSGNAAGIDVGNIGNNATLTFGDISADADEYAVAFKAGNLGTGVTITIKSVTSTANDSALGVGINEIGDGARINIDNIQADGIYGDGIGFQANIVNQSTLTFGGFTAVADYTAEGIQIGNLNSGATVNITGVGNATTFSYDGSGIATGVSIGSITGATINAKESTIYANVKDSDWGTGSGDATAVSVVGNIADSTLTFGTLDATVDKVGTAIGFSAQNVDASTITVDSINAQTLSVTETSTTGKGDAIGFQAQDISASSLSIAHAGTMTFDGDATGVDLRDIGDEAALTIGHIGAAAMNTGDAVGLSAQNVGENVTIKIDSTKTISRDGYADGVVLDDIGDGTEITIGTIEVDGQYGARGMSVGDIGNKVAIDVTTIDVKGNNGHAMGFLADDIGNGATLTFGDITIDAGEDAVAFKAGNVGENVMIEIDSVIAYSDGNSNSNDAEGVILGDIGNGATLTFGDITIDAGEDAVAFKAGNVGENITIEIKSTKTISWDGYADGVILDDIGDGTEITIGSIEVDGQYDAKGMSVGDIGNKVAIDVTTIDVESNAGDAMGFSAGDIGNGATLTIGDITIDAGEDAVAFKAGNVGENVTIEIKSTKTISRDGYADGVILDNIGNGTEITIGTIEVDGQYGAWGMSVDDIGNEVAIDVTTIDVKGNNGHAMGFLAGDIGTGATLTFGDIKAETESSGYGYGDATALSAGNVGSNVTIEINSAYASSDAGDAEGVILGDIGNGTKITIGSIEAYGDDDATGMQVGNITGPATIKVDNITVGDGDYGTGFQASDIQNDATLTFETIEVNADDESYGFIADKVGAASITIKSVTSTANDSALGVGINEIGDGARINIDNIQADGIYGDGIGFQANIVNQSTLTFGGFTAVADYTAEGIQIGSLNSGATLNITGVGNATTFSYDGSGIATGVSIGSITGATINAKESTIYANVKDSDWGTGSGDATAVSVVGNIADSTLTFGTLDATVDKVGTAIGFSAQNVDASTITVDSINAQTLSVTETSTTGKGDAIGFQAQDISASSLSIAHAGTMTFDGDATGVDLRDIGDEAALTIGHIDAAAMNTGDAVGLSAQNVDAATVGLGEIESTSVGGDAYGVRIKDQVGNDASLVITGDITAVTQKADGTGTAYGIFAKSFGSNGLIVDHTVSAVADVDAGNEAFAVYAADGNNKVTIEKNAVLDAHNTETVLEGWAIRFGANTQADSKNLVVFDTKGAWNNGGLIFNTGGVSDFTFEEGTVATITGTQNMTTGKDGVRTVASTTVVRSGASVILDGTQTHAVFNMASSADDAGTFHVEEGGSIDAFSKAGADSAAINGNLVLDGTMTLRFEGNDNVGLYVGDNGGEKGGVITVGDTAKIDVVLDGSFEGVLEVAETAWEDSEGNRDQIALDYISDKISTNTFYDLKAISVDGYLGYRGRDYVLMPEMFVLASQFHNARSIYDATADRFAQVRTRYAGIGACDQACSTYDCDRPMKKNSFGRNAWVNWVGRGNDQLRSRVTGGNMDFSSSGVQVGLDVYKSNRFLIGMMYGYEDGKLNAKDGYGSHMKGEDNYFGFYGQAILQNGFDLSGTIGYGSQDFDLVRSNRYGTHKASFDADSFEATLELGYMFKPRKNLTFRPVLALDIYNSDVDGATETGDWDRSRYNGYSLTQTFLRFGADARLTRKWFSVDTGVYYSYQMNSDAKTVSAGVTSVNQLITRPMEYKLGDSVLTVNVGGNVFLNKARTLSLFGGYYVDFYTDRINDQALHNGRVGVSYRF